MTAPAGERFGLVARLQAMLDVEIALAEAHAAAGLIPATSVPHIRAAARAEDFDARAVAEQAPRAGNLLIPLLDQLIRRVASLDTAAAGHVHLGVTSQDVIDTALAIQLRPAVRAVIDALAQAASGAAALARRHAATPMAGRTWLQQATPITFGLKAAVWLDGLARAHRRLALALGEALVLQLGGATGTLSSLGAAGPRVTAELAARLDLRVADIPWHTTRDRFVDLACALGIACGSLGKVGRDIGLLAQTEVAEVSEPVSPGRGRSSSMPHKHNPVASAVAASAAIRAPGLVATMLTAMVQEHERAFGGWQAEWEPLPDLIEITERSARAMAEALPALTVDAARMRANLDAAGGAARAEWLVAALAPRFGRPGAGAIVERLTDRALIERRVLEQAAAEDPDVRAVLSPAEIAAALDPARAAESSAGFIDAVLRRWAE